jgi:hypothetical protein
LFGAVPMMWCFLLGAVPMVCIVTIICSWENMEK